MKKNKLNLNNTLLALIGTAFLIVSSFRTITVEWGFPIIMFVFGIVKIVQFFMKEQNSLPIGICSILIGWIFILLEIIAEPLSLSFSLLAWLMLMSFIKLSEIDIIYNLKKQEWVIQMFNFLIFLVLGIFTSIYFCYLNINNLFLLSQFFFITGILDLIIKIQILTNKIS